MGKTLEEIDYVFASGEAKERLRLRFENAAHDSEKPAEEGQYVELKTVQDA